jgi:hypothetical protein
VKLTDFLEIFGTCDDFCKWALSTGCETIFELWLRDDFPQEWRIWMACHVLPQSTLRRFAFGCVFDILHLIEDPRSKQSLDVAKQYSDMGGTNKELIKKAMNESNSAVNGAFPRNDEASTKEWASWSAACAVKYAVSTVIEKDIRASVMEAAKAAVRASIDAACFAANTNVGSKVGAAAREEVRKRQFTLLLELAPTIEWATAEESSVVREEVQP